MESQNGPSHLSTKSLGTVIELQDMLRHSLAYISQMDQAKEIVCERACVRARDRACIWSTQDRKWLAFQKSAALKEK